MEIKPIRMTINAGLASADDAHASLNEHFRIVAKTVRAQFLERYRGPSGSVSGEASALLGVVSDFLAVMSRLDGEYGPDSALPIEDAADAVDEALRALAELESWLIRFELLAQLYRLHAIETGIGYCPCATDCL